MAKNKKRILLAIIVFVLVIGGISFYYINSIISTKFDITKTTYIYIDNSKDYNSILTQIDTAAHVQNMENFKLLANYMKYPENIKTGKYAIIPDMNIKDAIRTLQTGQQAAVKLTFNNIRTKADLAKRLSEQLMLSESALSAELSNSDKAAQYGFDTATFASMFIPNTYEVYWDIKPNNLLKRMNAEYKKFWNETRTKKAEAIGLSKSEVSTLASIVEEECFFADEYPTVAGLYLNRIKRGQLLQADPTVKFAVGDFSLKRILNKHLEIESPYNTYKNVGLPPGPIRVPSIKGIDAVLNPGRHEYLYMCAKEDFSGRHNFAKTHAEHERNANRYRSALNQRKIF